jgi:hypothetical protein
MAHPNSVICFHSRSRICSARARHDFLMSVFHREAGERNNWDRRLTCYHPAIKDRISAHQHLVGPAAGLKKQLVTIIDA